MCYPTGAFKHIAAGIRSRNLLLFLSSLFFASLPKF
uniref:Uncharacterized protein n=1 Tax=Anguilla anguilla TaxID=7936 RepID=A0A0E9VB15_ANGAN